MLDSASFWKELANTRLRVLLEVYYEKTAIEWARLKGTETIFPDGRSLTNYVNPLEILVVASPCEEITVTARFLSGKLGLIWHEALMMAANIFRNAEMALDMHKALNPKPGYEILMQRLISRQKL